MDPVPVVPLLFATGRPPRQSTAELGGDETKYDNRRSADKFAQLNRWMIAGMVLLGLVIFLGDGALLQKKIRGKNKSFRMLPGEVIRSSQDGNDDYYYPQDWNVSAPDNSVGSDYLPESGDGDVPAEPKADEIGGAADPKLAELHEIALKEAAAKIDAAEKVAGSVKDEQHPVLQGGARASPEAELNVMRDPAPSWSLESDARSCSGYFGNGFSNGFSLVGSSLVFEPVDAAGAAPTTQLGCWNHPITDAFYCRGTNIIVHPNRIEMSRGGEDLSAVMGRAEGIELPSFGEGAMEVFLGDVTYLGDVTGLVVKRQGGQQDAAAEAANAAAEVVGLSPVFVPAAGSNMERSDPYKFRMFAKTRVVDPLAKGATARECTNLITDPVIFITRVEYANLFHTTTDWFNAWQAARIAGIVPTTDYDTDALSGFTTESRRLEGLNPRRRHPRMPIHVIFLDGHNAGPMDDGWLGLFLSFNYIKHFEGPTCFTNVIFAPYGYHAAISQGMGHKGAECKGEPHVRQFGHDFVVALGMSPRAVSTCGQDPAHVLFVRRVNYLAHPRHDGRIVRRLDNEDTIMVALEQSAAQRGDMKLLNGMFSAMSLVEQVQSVQDACVMVGAHGAGLSHILFAPDGVHMLELQPPQFQRPHFIAYSFWAMATHHVWALSDSTPPPTEVVARIRDVVSAAGGGQAAGRQSAE